METGIVFCSVSRTTGHPCIQEAGISFSSTLPSFMFLFIGLDPFRCHLAGDPFPAPPADLLPPSWSCPWTHLPGPDPAVSEKGGTGPSVCSGFAELSRELAIREHSRDLESREGSIAHPCVPVAQLGVCDHLASFTYWRPCSH